MGYCCYDPGNRIGQVQHFQRAVDRKDRKDPEYTECAGSCKGYKHGDHRISHSS